jgi:protease IV
MGPSLIGAKLAFARTAPPRNAAAALIAVLFALTVGAIGCRGRATPGADTLPVASASGSATDPDRDPDPSRPHVAELNLSAGVPEIAPHGLLSSGRHRSFPELLGAIRTLVDSRDHRVKALLIRLGTTSMGPGRAQELAQALGSVRASGLPVICHADEYSNTTYWVASLGCERIWVSPAGGVDTVGLAAQLLYARRLLGELKIDVDMLQVGRFKGAAEPLTRDGPSDEARESLMGVLRSMRRSWIDGAVKQREQRGLQVSSLELGPHTPDEAIAKGLVDGVGYLDDARQEARGRAGVQEVVVRFGPGARGLDAPTLVGLVRALSGAGGGHDVPHVALVRAVGPISVGTSSSPLEQGDGISERRLSVVLRKLQHDEATKAVVVRIDSPGGSALASDLLWRQLMEVRKAKPLVVSVGDMAASGGYYMACAATRIFADPCSIVGSIGVVGGKLSIGRGLEHIGVHAELFSASEDPTARARASYLSPFEPWDSATRDRVLATMTSVYELFVRRVAEGRGMKAEQVASVAEGRIFSGADALGLGLIDELGGVQKAIDSARVMAGLGADAPVRVIGEEGGLQRLLEVDDDEFDEQARAAERMQDRAFRSLASLVAPEFVAFARAFEPLTAGEHTLVAVPFAILIR